VHFPALSVMAKLAVVAGLQRVLPNVVIFIVLALAALSAGVMFHCFVEKRLPALWSAHARPRVAGPPTAI
jgi:peptidoglycan/LPS O-acetylase OafA/YrhL